MNHGSVLSNGIGDPSISPVAVVAIPVCNEVERIHSCLKALAGQIGLQPRLIGIVLFLNNCTDGTGDVVRRFADMPWPMRVLEVTQCNASAGWARRMAMDAAADWLSESSGQDGILLTTDADSCVGADWVARNVAVLSNGADAVAGRISLDPEDSARLPPTLHARGKLESQYEALLTEIDALLDPDPSDPWPCHWTESGATLATWLSVYRRVGGMPNLPQGEDRAFIAAVRDHDLAVRHDLGIEVVTSGRLDGRASGGVADTIKLRCDVPESLCDDRLEGICHILARVFWRRVLRHLFKEGRLSITWLWAPPLSINRQTAKEIIKPKSFGAIMANIEAASPRLRYLPLRPAELPRQIRHAHSVLRLLKTFTRREHSRRSAALPIVLEENHGVPTR